MGKKKSTPETATTAQTAPTVMMIELGRIYVSKFNPRRIKQNYPAIAELVRCCNGQRTTHRLPHGSAA